VYILKSSVMKECDKDVYGNFVRGGAIFLSVFSSLIEEVNEKNNGIDSFL
jgi:hypothetical protein